ncbi:uncharacterized protein CDAR_169561, partial [Caerostris darwini]
MRNLLKSRFQLCGNANVNSVVLILLAILSSCCVVSETVSELAPSGVQKCRDAVPECECFDSQPAVILHCWNVSDFEKFNENLNKMNTLYTINVYEDSFLPRGFLRGLSVLGLIVDGPHLEGLEEGAFEGVVELKHFFVLNSSATKVPDFRFIRDSVFSIVFRSSRLTSLEGPNLQDLPELKILSFYNNSIEYVAPDAFQGTEGVTNFDISHNRLTHLPPDLFKPWTKLDTVVLSHNQLLHVDQLFFRTDPRVIRLDHNNLTDLDSVLHPVMFNVDELYLSHNPFTRVTENSFNGKVSMASYIGLDNCLIQEFNVRHYMGLPRLFRLELKYNLIDKIINLYEANYTDDYIKEFK